METDYAKIKLNPLFDPVKKTFEFYILGTGFITQKDFQQIIAQRHPYFAPFINTYNREVNFRKEEHSIKAATGLYWTAIGRLMAISLFDILQFSKYHNSLKNTEIFKFAKHIRNGAAHNNKFNLNPPLIKSIHWKDKIINQDLNNKKVFPDFIGPPNLIMLMSDISRTIEEKERSYK